MVNEALCCGCYAVVSDKCGAKELLKDDRCGKVFRSGDASELQSIIKSCAANIDNIRSNRQWRKDWAARSISGEVLAQYVFDCLTGVVRDAPWQTVRQ